jgi:predicted nucleic acid-binding protein
MFLLDTNVLSAIMSPNVPASVGSWIEGTPLRFLYATAISQAEILAGIAILPEGRRRAGLASAALGVFEGDFAGKLLPFDSAAAAAYAEIFAARRGAGLHTKPIDLMIAAIALSHDLSIVTRNVDDFDGCGVGVINPWGD